MQLKEEHRALGRAGRKLGPRLLPLPPRGVSAGVGAVRPCVGTASAAAALVVAAAAVSALARLERHPPAKTPAGVGNNALALAGSAPGLRFRRRRFSPRFLRGEGSR